MKMTALKQTISAALQISLDLASEKGASAQLMVLPIEEHGFSLRKQAFKDVLCVCYDGSQADSLVSAPVGLSSPQPFSCSMEAYPQFDTVISKM